MSDAFQTTPAPDDSEEIDPNTIEVPESEYVPTDTDNGVRPEDGEQDVTQDTSPTPVEPIVPDDPAPLKEG